MNIGSRIDPVLRFWSKVDKRCSPGPHGECWMWTGGVTGRGFGYFWDGWRNVLAHVFAWQLDNGRVPDGSCVLQQCGNRLCIRHLYLAPKSDARRPRHSYAFPLATNRNMILAPCQAGKDISMMTKAKSTAGKHRDLAAEEKRQEAPRNRDAMSRDAGKR